MRSTIPYSSFHTMAGRASRHEDKSRRRAVEVLEKHRDSLLDHPEVTALDVGYKRKDGIEQCDGEICH